MFGSKRQQAPEAEAEAKEAAPAKPKAVPPPVTRAEFDALIGAIAAVLAQVEIAASAPPGHIQSRLDYRLGLVAGGPADFGLSSAEAAAFNRLVRMIDGARAAAGARELRRVDDDSWRRRPPPM